jgi:hypothetical protein
MVVGDDGLATLGGSGELAEVGVLDSSGAVRGDRVPGRPDAIVGIGEDQVPSAALVTRSADWSSRVSGPANSAYRNRSPLPLRRRLDRCAGPTLAFCSTDRHAP